MLNKYVEIAYNLKDYLVEKGLAKEKLENLLDNAVYVFFEEGVNNNIKIWYNKEEYSVNIKEEDVYGFETEVVKLINSKIVVIGYIVGLNKDNSNIDNIRTVLHESLHLFSSNTVINNDINVEVKSGLIRETYALDHYVSDYYYIEVMREFLNEGITEYLASRIFKQLGYVRKEEKEDYFVEKETIKFILEKIGKNEDIDYLLDIYFNNKWDDFYKVVKGIGITEDMLFEISETQRLDVLKNI